MAVKTIILNEIPGAIDVFYQSVIESSNDEIASTVELFTEHIYRSLTNFMTFNNCDINLFKEMNIENILCYLHFFGNYINALCKSWHVWNQTERLDRQNDVSSKNFIENVMMFIENLSMIPLPSTIQLQERFCKEKSQLTNALFSLVFDFCGRSILYDTLKRRVAGIQWNRCIETSLIKFLISKEVRIKKNNFDSNQL